MSFSDVQTKTIKHSEYVKFVVCFDPSDKTAWVNEVVGDGENITEIAKGGADSLDDALSQAEPLIAERVVDAVYVVPSCEMCAAQE